MKSEDNLGIPNYGPWYINADDGNEEIEYILTNKFIMSSLKELHIDVFNKIKFINYGSMELVFVLEIKDKLYTVLVSQPKTEYGKLKIEYDNLIRLNKRHSEVVKPIVYISDDIFKKELYITPYLYQARCIGINSEYQKWSIWIPEPSYHYHIFKDEERFKINTCMLGEILRLYDEDDNIGLAGISLGSGDFTLNKNLKNMDEGEILDSLSLIAARKLIKMDYDEYVKTLARELTSDTERKICKKNLEDKFTTEEIYYGIELGTKLRKTKHK